MVKIELFKDCLVNYKNYYMYANDIKDRKNKIFIYVPEDIIADNIYDHIHGIYNILKDGIDDEYIHNLRFTISWGGDYYCDLGIGDYWFNLFMWSMLLHTDQKISTKHIYWKDELKRHHIKEFVDEYILSLENKIKYGNFELNNIMCDDMWYYSYIDTFSWYLANTINNEDDIELMNALPEYEKLINCDLNDVSFDNIKSAGMDITHQAIDIVKDSKKYIGYDHGLANSFRAGEAVSDRQYKEARHNIGAKPNGTGQIYPYNINQSFSNGGINNPLYYLIEATSSRFAQILSKINVGNTGETL